MEPIDIGIYVSAGMLVMVFLGMRVAFAAGLAGFIGLVWLRWNQFDYDPDRLWKAVEISVKIAGQDLNSTDATTSSTAANRNCLEHRHAELERTHSLQQVLFIVTGKTIATFLNCDGVRHRDT